MPSINASFAPYEIEAATATIYTILSNKREYLRFNVSDPCRPAFAKRRPDRQGLHERQPFICNCHGDLGVGGLYRLWADLPVLRNADNGL